MNRYFGKYRGLVVDADDPDGQGRLKARVPAVFGDAAVSGWAMPCVPYAGPDRDYPTPPAMTPVWVEFEHGNPDRPIWVGVFRVASAAD